MLKKQYDREDIGQLINKMLGAKEIGIELDLLGTKEHNGVKLFLVETSMKDILIARLAFSCPVFEVLNYTTIQNKEENIKDMIENEVFGDIDIEELDDNENIEKINLAEKIYKSDKRKEYENIWVDKYVERVNKTLAKFIGE